MPPILFFLRNIKSEKKENLFCFLIFFIYVFFLKNGTNKKEKTLVLAPHMYIKNNKKKLKILSFYIEIIVVLKWILIHQIIKQEDNLDC